MAAALTVLLGDLPVGRLTLTASDGADFRLLASYKRASPRPVLGQRFLDDLDKVWSARARTPTWFSNLLPEGPLRKFIAQKVGVDTAREFFLLRHLGEDLPGAVRIVRDESEGASADEAAAEEEGLSAPASGEETDIWRFSLAGVQLKLSAQRQQGRLTIPVSGRGGDWIVKLPDTKHSQVPHIEFATMGWAKASGVAIPELELAPIADITGLPPSFGDFSEPYALAVRRFDRPRPDARVHMEDFAQILGLYPAQKYDKYNYEALAKIIKALGREDDLGEFIRRLVFMVASGNGDMHHKNWSMIYPDGLNASLSPAYDLVSTIQYNFDDTLALNLGGSKRWEDVALKTFLDMARKIGVDDRRMTLWVDQARTAILESWRNNRGDFGFDALAQEKIQRHLARVPLLRP